MSAIDRSLDAVAFVSDHFRDILHRRLRELLGLALMTMALIGAIALATWSVQDPSLSHANSAPTHNLLGTPGAIAADLLMQLFGLAAVALLLPFGMLGWRLMSHHPLGNKWRHLGWLPIALLSAAFASCLPLTKSWPLPSGLGGVIGDALLKIPALILRAPLAGFELVIAASVLVIAAAATFLVTAGWRWPSKDERRMARRVEPKFEERDEFEDDRDQAWFGNWLGMMTHALLSARARIARRLRGAPDTQRMMPAAPRSQRTEPRFDGTARRYAVPVEEEIDDPVESEETPTPRRRAVARPARRSSSGYELPSIDLLAKPKSIGQTLSADQIQANAVALESVLQDFGVRGEIINARPGPVVTLYELEPAPGIKSSRVIGLADDIARSMSAVSARVAVVSGRNAIGTELPNPTREKVYFREQLSSDEYINTAAKLPLCLGKTIGGEPVIVDLARMPHLLIAGTTGSGKSVAINTMLLSLLYKLRP
ncbi:MAG: DNA translocase FtsK, partial [Pseudolabrys sp.]|nr:DNA translocase FtsK [Pseudolabrys sp.]